MTNTASVSASWTNSAGDAARVKSNDLRADSAAVPEAVATEWRTTPPVLRNAGKITPRAKAPAPIQPTLSAPVKVFLGSKEASDAGIALAIVATGYSTNTV